MKRMSSKTKFLNLKKPDSLDYYDIEDFNNNADIIDKKTQELANNADEDRKRVDNLLQSNTVCAQEIGKVSANLSKETTERKDEVDIERKRIDNLIKELPSTTGEYQQSNLVLHSYDNTAVKCGTTSGNYTNVPAFVIDAGGPLSSLYTKKSNYQIAVKKSGLYLFELRIHVNSLTANKRVELVPFVNGNRNAALASSYNTAGDFTLTWVIALPLWLSANDTVDFRIAPIEAATVSLQLGDVLVYAIDWEDKFKIPDYDSVTTEVADLRVGADNTVYDTAGEAVRAQFANLKEFSRELTNDVSEYLLGAPNLALINKLSSSDGFVIYQSSSEHNKIFIKNVSAKIQFGQTLASLAVYEQSQYYTDSEKLIVGSKYIIFGVTSDVKVKFLDKSGETIDTVFCNYTVQDFTIPEGCTKLELYIESYDTEIFLNVFICKYYEKTMQGQINNLAIEVSELKEKLNSLLDAHS